ncbi:MAG: sensor histidine kinase [Planctomycetota bacterium]
MYFRTRLGVQIAVGTAALMTVTGAIRSAIVRHELVASATTAAETAAQDVLWELDRRLEQAHGRLKTPDVIAARRSFVHRSTAEAWSELVKGVVHSPEETLVVVGPAGEILQADGALASDRAFVGNELRAKAFAGDPSFGGDRTGVLAGGQSALVAASVQLDPTREGEGRDAVSVGARLILVAPLAARPSLVSTQGLDVTIYSAGGEDVPEDIAASARDLWRGEGHVAEMTSTGAREIHTIEDGAGRRTFLLCANAHADVGTLVPQSVLDNLLWEALVAAAAIALALRFVHVRVGQPMEQLSSQASRLARSEHGQLSLRPTTSGPIGDLTITLDAMLKKIELDRSRFVRNARIAGMSDVSMGVVHSAGNILNSVNISAKLLLRELKTIEVDDLKALVTELREHVDDLDAYVKEDENGRFLIPFLAAMTEAFAEVRARCLIELETVDRGVAHVVDLIRSQEKYAIGASVVETTDVTEVVEMALQVASMTIEGSESVIVDRAFADLTSARVDRHRLTSILINLISNAIEALLVVDESERRLEISTYPMDGERFVIEITDTGIGIAPENLDLIFTSAFTTKAGSSGEGLHTTANACRELGIAIGAVSQGTDCGCTFKLRVPYEPPRDGDAQGVGAVRRAGGDEPQPAAPVPAGAAAAAVQGNGVRAPQQSIPLVDPKGGDGIAG